MCLLGSLIHRQVGWLVGYQSTKTKQETTKKSIVNYVLVVWYCNVRTVVLVGVMTQCGGFFIKTIYATKNCNDANTALAKENH